MRGRGKDGKFIRLTEISETDAVVPGIKIKNLRMFCEKNI
jgi:hypothetical protein